MPAVESITLLDQSNRNSTDYQIYWSSIGKTLRFSEWENMHNLFSPIPKLPWWDQNGIRTGVVGVSHTGKKEATYLKLSIRRRSVMFLPTLPPNTHTHTTHPPIESTRSLGQGKRFSFFLWDRRRRKVGLPRTLPRWQRWQGTVSPLTHLY